MPQSSRHWVVWVTLATEPSESCHRFAELACSCLQEALAVSHAYAHIFDLGIPVAVDGMEVSTGTLLHGDQHGMVTIPMQIAAEVPNVASKLQRSEREVIEFCQSKNFSVEKLGELMKKTQ